MKKPDKSHEAQPPEKSGDRPRDVVVVHGVTEDRKGLRVLRARDETIEAGEVRPLKEGQPITSDVVRLHARKGAPFVYDVETAYTSSDSAKGGSASRSGAEEGGSSPHLPHAGPARVASQAYRENWDAIWAKVPLGKGSSELN